MNQPQSSWWKKKKQRGSSQQLLWYINTPNRQYVTETLPGCKTSLVPTQSMLRCFRKLRKTLNNPQSPTAQVSRTLFRMSANSIMCKLLSTLPVTSYGVNRAVIKQKVTMVQISKVNYYKHLIIIKNLRKMKYSVDISLTGSTP